MHHSDRRGITLVEVVISISSCVVLLTLCSMVFASDGHGVRTRARTLKDTTQLGLILQAFLTFANQYEGRLPRPGLIDRLPTDLGGGNLREVPGLGGEDIPQNTTANLYSSMIAQNFLTMPLLISPVERNPKVELHSRYNFEAYHPVDDTYWDAEFKADLDILSHTSYGHLPLFGERMERHWRNTNDAKYVVLGNRGPEAGEPDSESNTCGPHGLWAGNVVFADNHIEFLTTMTPDIVNERVIDNQPHKDNIFAMEEGADGGDIVLAFTTEMTNEGPELQYD